MPSARRTSHRSARVTSVDQVLLGKGSSGILEGHGKGYVGGEEKKTMVHLCYLPASVIVVYPYTTKPMIGKRGGSVKQATIYMHIVDTYIYRGRHGERDICSDSSFINNEEMPIPSPGSPPKASSHQSKCSGTDIHTYLPRKAERHNDARSRERRRQGAARHAYRSFTYMGQACR
jgi:hypothetical protein